MPESTHSEACTVATKVGRLRVECRGNGTPILCWPSLYCDARTLDPLVVELERDYRLIVVEGPGHGGSSASPGRFSLEDCADAAMEILDALQIASAIWLGAAWGGHIGVAAARRHRDRIDGLVILNAPMTAWKGARLALMRLSYALLWLFGPRSFVAPMIADKMLAASLGRERAAFKQGLVMALGRCDRRGLLLAARSAMFDRGDLVRFLPDVHVPTLFFTGDEDTLFPVEEARAQAAAIPDCRFVIVRRSSHQSALEAPATVLPVLREALCQWRNAALRCDTARH